LKDHHLFSDRDSRFVELLSRDVKVEVFRPGEVIVKEGAKGNSMYILRRGEVDIIAGGVQVARLGSGSVFGEILLLGVADRRTATVRASEFSDCRVVQRKYLQRLLRLFPREKLFFEHLARQRIMELKAAAPVGPRRVPKAGPNPEGKEDSLPLIDDEATDQKAVDYSALMATFSRFFEKPSWRTGGTLKKSSQQFNSTAEPRIQLVSLKEMPQLPPLITRSVRAGWTTEPSHDEDNNCDFFFEDVNQLPAAKGDAGTGYVSSRSPSPRSPSPKQRFFMYEKGRTASPVGSKAPRRTDARNRPAESLSPKLPEQLE